MFQTFANIKFGLQQNIYSIQRMWNGGVSVPSGAIRGRGGSVDRGGRGRNGRGGLYPSHYTRGVGFDEPGEGSRTETQPFPVNITRDIYFSTSKINIYTKFSCVVR